MSLFMMHFFFFKQTVWAVAVVVVTHLLEQTTAVSLSSLPEAGGFVHALLSPPGFLPPAQAPFPPNSLPLEGALGEAELWLGGALRKQKSLRHSLASGTEQLPAGRGCGRRSRTLPPRWGTGAHRWWKTGGAAAPNFPTFPHRWNGKRSQTWLAKQRSPISGPSGGRLGFLLHLSRRGHQRGQFGGR